MTTKQTVTVKYELVEKAWTNWIEFHYGIDNDATSGRFMFYATTVEGYSESNIDPWSYEGETVELTPDQAQRINQAAGPHCHTIFKAWYAAHPWRTLRD